MKILRNFHDLSRLITNTDLVICHGDPSPNNVVFKDNEIIGIIDYDSIYIGNKLDDIAYAMFTWLDIGDYYNDFNNLIPIMANGLKYYDLNNIDYNNFPKTLIKRANKIIADINKDSSWYQRTKDWALSIIDRINKYEKEIIEKLK